RDDETCDAPRDRQGTPEHEQSDETSDPDGARGQVQPVERERDATRRRLRGVTRRTGYDEHGQSRHERSDRREQLRDRARGALGPVEPQRDEGGGDEEREAELEVEVTAPECGRVEEGDDRADV